MTGAAEPLDVASSRKSLKDADIKVVGQTRDWVDTLAKRLMRGWRDAPVQHVVQRVRELPDGIRELFDENQPALLHRSGNTLYVVADNVRDAQDLQVIVTWSSIAFRGGCGNDASFEAPSRSWFHGI